MGEIGRHSFLADRTLLAKAALGRSLGNGRDSENKYKNGLELL